MESENLNVDVLEATKDVSADKEHLMHESHADTSHTFVQPIGPVLFKKPVHKKLPSKELPTAVGSGSTTQCNAIIEEVNTEEMKCLNVAEETKLVPIPYKEPSWSGTPSASYSFEVLRGGVVIDTVTFDKPYLVFGRLKQCDVMLEHPSISRYHCVVQYRREGSDAAPEGVYVYDLSSTHGSYQNKLRLQARVYNRLRVGHMLKFGGSSRNFLLLGPSEDKEAESLLSVKELQEIAKKKQEEKLQKEMEKKLELQKKEEQRKKEEEERGVDWGMGPDAADSDGDENDPDAPNPYSALLQQEELNLDDPKKSLRGWYEREGYDLPEYDVTEVTPGHYKCVVKLPVLGPGGEPLIACVDHHGKKKDTVVQAALEACRTLDKHGMFRQATHVSHERPRPATHDSDDEDEFLDRTGDVARKRDIRVGRRGARERVFTYQDLCLQHSSVLSELQQLCERLLEVRRLQNTAPQSTDDLDDFMRGVARQLPDKHKTLTWKLKCVEARKEEARLRRLVNAARPPTAAELTQPDLPLDLILPQVQPSKKKESTVSKVPPSTVNSTVKGTIAKGVHAVFLEDDEVPKLKLTKLDSSDDNVPKAIPYDKRVYKTVPGQRHQRLAAKYVMYDSSSGTTDKETSETLRSADNIDSSNGNELSKKVGLVAAPEDTKVTEISDQNDKTIENEADTGVSSTSVNLSESVTLDQQADLCSNADNLVSVESEETETKADEISQQKKKRKKEYALSDMNSDFKTSQSNTRPIGPTKPSQLELVQAAVKRASGSDGSDGSTRKKKAAVGAASSAGTFDFDDPRLMEDWVPPTGQTGDGRTRLNDMLGY